MSDCKNLLLLDCMYVLIKSGVLISTSGSHSSQAAAVLVALQL